MHAVPTRPTPDAAHRSAHPAGAQQRTGPDGWAARVAAASGGGDAADRPRPARALQISKFYPPVRGGIETVAWELTEGLNRAGIRTDVLCSSDDRLTRNERAPSGYRVMRVGSVARLLSTSIAPSMPGVLRAIQSRYDMIHLHMPDPMAALAVLACRPRARLVVHWHSDVIRQRFAMHAYRPLQDWVLRRADAVIATSEPYADSSEALRPWRHKVRVVPIGISDRGASRSTGAAAALRARFPGKRIVFSLGRMTYYKGFDVLIEAAETLPDDCVVLIGGHGELLETLRQDVAARGLSHKVHVTGHLSDDELPAYFEACDVFCMPSTVRAEAYGVAIVEAMMMGKPVVATDIPGSGVPWVNVHGITGFNVPVRNAAALADTLARVLRDDRLRVRLGTVGRVRYVQELRADLMTQRTLGVYASVLQGTVVGDAPAEFEPTWPGPAAAAPAAALGTHPAVASVPTPRPVAEPAIPRHVPSVEPSV